MIEVVLLIVDCELLSMLLEELLVRSCFRYWYWG